MLMRTFAPIAPLIVAVLAVLTPAAAHGGASTHRLPHDMAHAGHDRRIVVSGGEPGAELAYHEPFDARSGGNSSTSSAHSFKTDSACGGRVTPKNGNFIVTGYWPDWVGSTLTPSEIPWDKYDLIYYAFGTPTKSGGVNLDSGSDSLLKQLVSNAQKHNTKVVLSVGGWSDSKYFSSLVATSSSRSKFASSLKSYYTKYSLGGIDIDWEYPNDSGAGSNEKSASDADNFATFFTLLRKEMPNAILSAATTQSTWNGKNGNPLKDVSKFASALDFVFVMNYDVWGSSSNPGPNAPLANLCGNSDQPDASAAAAVNAWTAAGMPREKILMGMPMYGYVSKSSATKLQQRAASEDHSHRKPSQEEIQQQQALLHPGQGSSFKQSQLSSGQNNFNVLVAQGYLIADGSGNYKAESGWTLKRDACSDTPYMYDHQQVITYDDPLSIYEKSVFSALSGIAGVGFWSIEGDTKKQELVNAAIKGLTLQPF